jgi:MFS family permease
MLFEQFGRSAPFIAGAVATVVALAVALIFVKEPPQTEAQANNQEKSAGVLANLKTVFTNPDKSGLFVLLSILLWFIAFNALETALSSFAVFVLGISPGNASIYSASVTFSFLVFAIPAGLLATRIGRQRTIRIGLAGLTLLLLVGWFIIQDAATFIAVLVIAGIFWALVNVNSLPLVYDHGDERKIGAYTGLYYFASQTAAVLGPTLGGILVDAMGDQYRFIWPFSTLFMALAFLTMLRVKEAARPKEVV